MSIVEVGLCPTRRYCADEREKQRELVDGVFSGYGVLPSLIGYWVRMYISRCKKSRRAVTTRYPALSS